VNVATGCHGVDEGYVVHASGEIRNQATHPLAALSVLRPLPGRLHDLTGCGLKEFDLFARVPGLGVALDQLRLVVIHVALARRAGHEQLDDSLCRGGMMPDRSLPLERVAIQEVRECDASESTPGVEHERATVHHGVSRHRGTRCC
jgi:hypothetical protein